MAADITSIEVEEIEDIATQLIAAGHLIATDGYERDITPSIVATYTRNPDNFILIHCTFSVTNMFQDTNTVNHDILLSLKKPLIVLTESSVNIKAGTYFDPTSYIQMAVDMDGTSLMDRITIESNVDVNTPGIYTVRYFTYNHSWVYSAPQDLIVVVAEDVQQ